MNRILALGTAAFAALTRRKPREVKNVEQRCAAIDWFANAARD